MSLDTLVKYCSAGAAQMETAFLNDVFVPFNDLDDLLNIYPNQIKIMVGNKGSGKTATLEYIFSMYKKLDIPVLKLNTSRLKIGTFSNDVTISTVQSEVYEKLIVEIASNIGENLPTFVEERFKVLLETAIKEGKKDSGLFRTILKSCSKSIAKTDLEEYYKIYGTNSCYRALDSYFKSDDNVFCILFDDIELSANRNNNNFLVVIWGIINAISDVAKDFPNVRPIVSLMTESWRAMSKIKSPGFQLDHFKQLTFQLNPNDEDLMKILRKRINYCRLKDGACESEDQREIYSLFFEGDFCSFQQRNAPDKRRYWEDYLLTSSRFRPRDTMNLISMLAKNAKNRSSTLISNNDISDISYEFSSDRITILGQENQDRCERLTTVIDYMYKANDENKIDGIINVLRSFLSAGELIIDGKKIYDNQESLLYFLDFLYDIEFIFARDADSNEKENYCYIRPKDKPNLINNSTISDLQPYAWDIHPSYRPYLHHRARTMDARASNKGRRGKVRK